MSVGLPAPGELLPVPGVKLASAAANIHSTARDDLVLLVFEASADVSAVFTKSSFRAAPVEIAESRIRAGGVRALLINSGNANAATGNAGHEAALGLCDTAAQILEIDTMGVAPFSTGVIGEQLPFERMNAALSDMRESLVADGWQAAAAAIMTTDTAAKVLSHQVQVGESTVTITGMAKGAGMIKPDMATLLAFICCDAAIERVCLDQLVREVADASFNRITIDGDTSTNDSFVLAATGTNNLPPISETQSAEYGLVKAALLHVAQHLAQCIVRDGEGATKFVTVDVTGARETAEALEVAYTIAESPLVKTALFAGDPNWGRLCMAIGRAGVEDLDVARVNVFLGEVCVVRGGLKDTDYEESAGARVMAQDEFEIRVELGRGSADAVIWTSDLSYEYVRINAEYRT